MMTATTSGRTPAACASEGVGAMSVGLGFAATTAREVA